MKYLFTQRFKDINDDINSEFNLALTPENDFDLAMQNRAELSCKIGTKNLIFMNQVHKNHVEIIKNKKQKIALQSDAMITNLKNVALCVMVADCIPLLFCDESKNVVGAAHAGRAGVLQKIANHTIEKMADEFFCEIGDIKVYIGPCIGKCCYEVKNDVVGGFEGYLHRKNRKLFLDIRQKCIDDMLLIGIKKENIEITDNCTCCDENYFSYRREATKSRFCGVIAL